MGVQKLSYINLCQSDKQNKHIVISLLDQGKYGSVKAKLVSRYTPLIFLI